MDADRQQWLERRRQGIGGSDAAAVVGKHPYKSRLEVYREKVLGYTEEELTGPQKRGIKMEPLAAEEFEEQTGRSTRRQPQKAHPDHDCILANIDRQILATDDGQETELLEIKVPGIQVFNRCKDEGLPEHWILQGQHYLGVYGYPRMRYAVFDSLSWELLTFPVEPDPDLIEALFDAELRFWHDHVEPEVPPEPATDEDVETPEVSGEMEIVEDGDLREAMSDLLEARELKKRAEDHEDAAKERVKAFMEEQALEAIRVPGVGKAYNRQQSGRSVDRDLLGRLTLMDGEKVVEIVEAADPPDGVVRRLIEEASIPEERLWNEYTYSRFTPYPEGD